MKKIIILCALLISVIGFVSFDPGARVVQPSTEKIFQDSLEEDRQKYIRLVKESIQGKENMRADSVFKNIQMLKVPAGRLLSIMNIGYSRSLGVSCGHCHNTSDFSSEEKGKKEITRQMAAMSAKINNELLKGIPGLNQETARINCTTCHRGEVKPALDLRK